MKAFPLKVFLGYDHVEAISYNVFAHSIQSRSSQPVQITPIRLSQLKGDMWRERHPKQSNDFAFSRWLVPYLCNYEGYAVFADCDMLCLDDITKLFEEADHTKAVSVVKHNYTPKTETKFLNNEQTVYEKKNWSSVILFNCAHPDCRKLTPHYINNADGLDLHRFKWVQDESLIGDLPSRWNHLVGEYDYKEDVSIVHFTIGGPWFLEYRDVDYSDLWQKEKQDMLHCDQVFVPNVSIFNGK